MLDKPPEPAWDSGAGRHGWTQGDAWWAPGAGPEEPQGQVQTTHTGAP